MLSDSDETNSGGYSYTLMVFLAVVVLLAVVFQRKVRLLIAGKSAGAAKRRRYDRRTGRDDA